MRVISRCGGAPNQAAVFAAELRGVFISHTHCGASRVEVQHQLAGFDHSFFANGSPRVAAAKSVSLDLFKIGQPQGPARS
jgi:hypothetical protein